MASEAVVSFVVQKLGDLLIQEAQLLHGVHDQFQWIQTELKRMRCFLKDADSRQKEDEGVSNWVAEIIDASYDAEDVIDIYLCSQRRRRGIVERVQRYICVVSELRTRHKVAKKIDRIKAKISDITRSRETYGIRDINEGRQEASSSSQSLQGRRRRVALLEETKVVGQLEGINTVKEQLMSDELRRCVISIIGMGGLGKTTLAKKVYHDVKHDFNCHAFVYLSQQFGIKDVLMRILKCVMGLSPEEGEKMNKLNEDELEMMLHDQLREKRYLVVIDDIWSEEAWDMLKLVLPDRMNKSRVMLTTRIKDVALHADPSCHPHEMRLLNEDEGWELFMKKIFPEGDPSTACPAELEKTGRKILAKCGGLPLAILVLGGLLSGKDRTFSAWSKVLESVNRRLTESSDQCRDILALSYWDLPYYLKPCFLYLGLFPEDHEIVSTRLINMWISEGFISQKDNGIMEDVAEDYLEELVGRSMIQVAIKKPNESAETCRIHDLLRDLSISEASQNNFLTLHNDNGTSSSSTSVRRLALYGNIDGHKHINCSIATLRSLLWFSDYEDGLQRLLISSGKLLRVFDAPMTQILRETTKEGEFSNLRYLRISTFASTKSLSFIENLSNLLTLEITSVGILPNAIWNLEELRHLCAPFCSVDGHPQLNYLRNLQTLSLRAGSWIEAGLEKLTNLRDLEIHGDVSSYHKALSESIVKLCNLRSLLLLDGHSIPPFMPFAHHLYLYCMLLDGRIEKLPVLPPNLVELLLCDSKLKQDAISMLEKLQHLKILRFLGDSYDSKKMLCSLGGFPRLEELELGDLPLEEWIVEEGAMQSLKSVELRKMPNLKTLPEQIRVLSKENTCSLKRAVLFGPTRGPNAGPPGIQRPPWGTEPAFGPPGRAE